MSETDSKTSLVNSLIPIKSSIKDITDKLQTTSIIPGISPFNDKIDDVNVYTDETLIMDAEEAKESPRNGFLSVSDRKFDDIGKQKFHEKILFKHGRRKHRAGNVMFASTSSLSSNSSEDRDFYNKPTLMTLSSVGVLPDMRSPESIQNDIEYKEKILADILNLDSIKIPLEKMTERTDSIEDEVVEKASSGSLSECDESDFRIENIRKNDGPKIVPKICKKNEDKPPACVDIPNEWNLDDIQLNVTKDAPSTSDNSLTDWVII